MTWLISFFSVRKIQNPITIKRSGKLAPKQAWRPEGEQEMIQDEDDTPLSRPMSPMEQINLIQGIEFEKSQKLEEPTEQDLEVGKLWNQNFNPRLRWPSGESVCF